MRFLSGKKFISGITLLVILGATVVAAPPAPSSVAPNHKPSREESKFVFSFLPKSFQSHPMLSMTVLTEMTDEGRKLKPPTLENPTYYFARSSGYHHEGDGADEKGRIAEDGLQKQVEASLATSGYKPGTPDHPPTLVLFYVWGAHTKIDTDTSGSTDGTGDTFQDLGFRNLLSRAALVGGKAFAAELAHALVEQGDVGVKGDNLMNPVYRFTNRDDKTRQLMEQTLDDCYYVVVSAYEGAKLAKGEKILLWRTKMTTAAQGVSLAETAPVLISSGGPHFGIETDTVLVDKRISRQGKVELGTARVEEYIDPPEAAKPGPPAKK